MEREAAVGAVPFLPSDREALLSACSAAWGTWTTPGSSLKKQLLLRAPAADNRKAPKFGSLPAVCLQKAAEGAR